MFKGCERYSYILTLSWLFINALGGATKHSIDSGSDIVVTTNPLELKNCHKYILKTTEVFTSVMKANQEKMFLAFIEGLITIKRTRCSALARIFSSLFLKFYPNISL